MSRPRRVLIASRFFPPEVSAGAFRLGALARASARRGNTVTVLTTRAPSHIPRTPDPPALDIRRWPVLRDAGGNVRGYLQYASFDVPLALRLIASRFDVVVAESPPTTGLVAATVAGLKRRPLVYYAADVWTDGVISMGAPKATVILMRWMERAVLRRAARIISVSEEVTERLLALGARADRIATVGNGIDTNIFTPSVDAVESTERYFVYTGTMSEWQRPQIFVRALALIANEFPDVRLRFFGQGAVQEEVRRAADRLLPDRVFFGGVIGPAESASWIKGAVASLVSIVPGIGYDFARPTKTYAAAACGTPVIFAGVGGGAEVVRSGELGEVVPFEAELVAEAMARALRAAEDGSADAMRMQRVAWARAHASLQAVGAEAAAEIDAC